MPPYLCALLLAHAGSSCGARIGKPDKIGSRVDASLEQSVKHLFFHPGEAARRNPPKSVRLSIETLPFVTWQTFSKFKCGTVRQAVGSQATVAGPWLLLLTHRGPAAYSSLSGEGSCRQAVLLTRAPAAYKNKALTCGNASQGSLLDSRGSLAAPSHNQSKRLA